MFTKRLQRYLKILHWATAKFGVIAGRYDDAKKSFSYDPKLEIKVTVNYSLVCFWMFAAFLIVIKYYVRKDVDRFNVTLAYWLAGILVISIFSALQWFVHDICLMVNSFVNFMNYMYEAYGKSIDLEKHRESLYLVVFFECLFFFAAGCYVLITIVLIHDPRGTFFLGDLIPVEYFHCPIPILTILFHAYLLLVVHVVCLTIATATLLFGFYFTPILIKELRMGRKNYVLSNNLRTLENVQHVYRCLQVLHATSVARFGWLILLNQVCIMGASIFTNFVFIKYWGQLQIISKIQLLAWTMVFMTFWGFVLELGRLLSTKGSKTLSSWKGNKWGSEQNNKLMKKFLKSCKPIVLNYGKMFVIGRVSVLVFFKGVVRGTFRALLTTKK